MATNYRPVANIPFLGKVLERVVAGQLQALLDETDYLDPFQSDFRPRYGTESALVALYDDQCREEDRGSASLLVLLDLSAVFDTIDHGTGLLLLIDLIRLLVPSHIIQISAENFKDMPQLSSEYIRSTPGLHTRGKCKNLMSGMEQGRNHGDFCPPNSDHKLLCVQATFPGAGVAGNGRTHSSILRDMAILGYLSQLQPPGMESVVPLHSLVPYQVPFNAVALRVIHADVAPAHILYSVNASWVGLCRLPDEVPCKTSGPVLLAQTPICDCLGFGIVRGVDVDKKHYYLLTPVAPENLRLVNCLLIGSIPIPNCIFLNQMGTEGEIPYVTSEYNYDISGAGKLKIKKHLKRREHRRP
ncbi:Polynucleotide 5'-hydroxyl-kinase NOL9 [Varanus komodoensis]|nr:Polynucleotide 5'-hydroxyl-kinase NOL9 [Varanus komodoensis]